MIKEEQCINSPPTRTEIYKATGWHANIDYYIKYINY